MPLVSVLVPVYNTKELLQKCLNSLKEQSLSDIEIIVIDDGSTDGSASICDDYARKDSRFKVVHKKNEGLSAARNDGLKRATGKFVMFVDSDDWVNSDFCKAPVNIAESSGADIVIFQFSIHKKRKTIIKSFPKTGITPKEEILTQLWEYVWAAAWNKLYRREILSEVEYPVGRLYEDAAVTHRLIYKAQRLYLLDKTLYHYRSCRPGSITNCRSMVSIDEYFYWNFRRIDDLKQWGFDNRKEECKYSFSYLVNKGENAEYSHRCKEFLVANKSEIKTLLTRKEKFGLCLYLLSPRIFDQVCILFGKRI